MVGTKVRFGSLRANDRNSSANAASSDRRLAWNRTTGYGKAPPPIVSTRMLRNGVIPIPPARRTAGRAAWCSRRSPNGPSIFTSVPSGIACRTRLNAVSRRRVVIVITSSRGALEIEKPRRLPSASVSGGSSRVISTNWPARYDQPLGFAKRNDIVRSATVFAAKQRRLEDRPAGLGIYSRRSGDRSV